MESGRDQARGSSGAENEETFLLANNKTSGLLQPIFSNAQSKPMPVMKNQFDFAFGRELFFGMDALRIVVAEGPKTLYELAQTNVRSKLSVVHGQLRALTS